MNELTVIEKGKELEFFTGGGLDPFLAEVKTMVEGFDHDMSTKKGRDRTRSFAAKIATFKVKVDDSGKELVGDWKAKSKAVDVSRKHSRDTLDALKEEARKPLTDWEQIDKDRIIAHEENLEALRNMVNFEVETSAAYAARLAETKGVEMGKCWEEFAADAAEAKDTVIEFLERGLAAATKSEAEAAELDRLRKEAAEREQKEREAAIAKVAADKAREDEELKARELAAKVESDKQEAIRREEQAKTRAEDAERETIAAEERAKVAAAEAEERRLGAIEQTKRDEAARIQREKEVAEETQRKVEANKRHVGKVRKQIQTDFVACGLSEEAAAKALTALVAHSIANVTINY